MFEQLSRQFDEAARAWETGDVGFGGTEMATMGVDLADRGEEFVVTADVPGFEDEDIELRLREGTLHIDATRERTTDEQAETYLRSERRRRSLRERVRLPEPVEEEGTEATLRNGVLTVRLPKAAPEETGGRRIDIE